MNLVCFLLPHKKLSCIYIYDDVTTCSPTAPLNIPTTTVLICENETCFLFCITNYGTPSEEKIIFNEKNRQIISSDWLTLSWLAQMNLLSKYIWDERRKSATNANNFDKYHWFSFQMKLTNLDNSIQYNCFYAFMKPNSAKKNLFLCATNNKHKFLLLSFAFHLIFLLTKKNVYWLVTCHLSKNLKKISRIKVKFYHLFKKIKWKTHPKIISSKS